MSEYSAKRDIRRELFFAPTVPERLRDISLVSGHEAGCVSKSTSIMGTVVTCPFENLLAVSSISTL